MSELKNIKGYPTNEKVEKSLAMCERYTLVHDNDGHGYVIKVFQINEFYQWVEHTEDEAGGDWEGYDYNESRIDGGMLTFVDPKVGHE